jgi:hypothetical protein
MCNRGGSPTVINCIFQDNAGGFGGAMSNDESDVMVINCTFLDNVASGTGAGIDNVDGAPTIINCTITGNTAGSSGGGMFNLFSTPTVINTIVWDNTPDNILDVVATTTVSYSDVQGGWAGAGTGNIDTDPLLVDPANGDVGLSPGSLCIDAADNLAVPADALDLDGDDDVLEPIPFDVVGNPRFQDDPGRPDGGNPDGLNSIVDMGSREFQGESTPGDLDGDGTVGINDFLALLAAWGPCPDPCPPFCFADIDGDCTVGITDFLLLLSGWG